MARYFVRWSGGAYVEADDRQEAEKQARGLAHVCGTFTALEVGKDVDELGWPIEKGSKR